MRNKKDVCIKWNLLILAKNLIQWNYTSKKYIGVDNYDIAKFLKRFRKSFNLTQKQVATVLGISQQSYKLLMITTIRLLPPKARKNRIITIAEKILLFTAEFYNSESEYLVTEKGKVDNL